MVVSVLYWIIVGKSRKKYQNGTEILFFNKANTLSFLCQQNVLPCCESFLASSSSFSETPPKLSSSAFFSSHPPHLLRSALRLLHFACFMCHPVSSIYPDPETTYRPILNGTHLSLVTSEVPTAFRLFWNAMLRFWYRDPKLARNPIESILFWFLIKLELMSLLNIHPILLLSNTCSVSQLEFHGWHHQRW